MMIENILSTLLLAFITFHTRYNRIWLQVYEIQYDHKICHVPWAVTGDNHLGPNKHLPPLDFLWSFHHWWCRTFFHVALHLFFMLVGVLQVPCKHLPDLPPFHGNSQMDMCQVSAWVPCEVMHNKTGSLDDTIFWKVSYWWY